MGLAEKYLPHYTYEDYLYWEGRWELHEGHPIAMSPMPVPEHQRLASEIRYQFMQAIKKKECLQCKAYDPLDYKISEDTILQPDILIVCGKINKRFLDFPAALVVEILSSSTEDRDREFKYEMYQQQGVKYYLIVDGKKKKIEIYELIDGKYQIQNYQNNFYFSLTVDCSISPDLDNIWD